MRADVSLTRARSTAHSFDIRRRSFCLLVALEDPTGKPVPLLVLRAGPDERDALPSIGHPFYAGAASRGAANERANRVCTPDAVRLTACSHTRRLSEVVCA